MRKSFLGVLIVFCVFLYFCLLFAGNAFAQTTNKGWHYLEIPDVGKIWYPPSIEIQSEEFRREGGSPEVFLNNKVIFQQRGLNKSDPSSYGLYARLIVENIPGKPGDFLRISDGGEIMGASAEDLEYLNNFSLAELKKQTFVKIVDFYGYRPVKVGERYPALLIAYKRKSTVSPELGTVLVRQYLIQNYKQMIKITASYRGKEEGMWKEDLLGAVNSIVLANEY